MPAKLKLVKAKPKSKDLAEELMKMRFRKSASQLNETHRLREVRKNLSRVKTLISQKENSLSN